MSSFTWFSSRIRYAVIVESRGLQFYMDSVRICRATGFEDAFERILEIGFKGQKGYLNGEGERIAWRFLSVLSLDQLPAELSDGQEVYSEPADPAIGAEIGLDTPLNPRLSSPTQTF